MFFVFYLMIIYRVIYMHRRAPTQNSVQKYNIFLKYANIYANFLQKPLFFTLS